MEKTKVNLNKVIMLNLSTNGIIGAVAKMNGSTLFKLNKTIGSLLPHLEVFNITKKKILEDNTTRDKKGELIVDKKGNKTHFKFEDGVVEKVNREILDLLDEIVEVELYKIPLSVFEEFQIDMSKVVGLDVFMDLLIDEDL